VLLFFVVFWRLFNLMKGAGKGRIRATHTGAGRQRQDTGYTHWRGAGKGRIRATHNLGSCGLTALKMKVTATVLRVVFLAVLPTIKEIPNYILLYIKELYSVLYC
jgi:hypothetical protein